MGRACLQTLAIFKPDTLVRWHREGYKLYWALKSRRRWGGRPAIDPEVRELIRTKPWVSFFVAINWPLLIAQSRELKLPGVLEAPSLLAADTFFEARISEAKDFNNSFVLMLSESIASNFALVPKIANGNRNHKIPSTSRNKKTKIPKPPNAFSILYSPFK